MKIFNVLFKVLVLLILVIILLLAFSYRKDLSLKEIKKNYCDSESKFSEVLGTSIHYKIEGKGDTLVLIHGTAASLHTWDQLTNILKDEYTIVRFDLPAFGVTGPSKDRNYKIESYVNHVDGLLENLGIDQFHLLGNSLGGRISWNYTLEHPEKVEKLVLLDASGYPFEDAPLVIKLANIPILSNILKKCTPSFFIKKNLLEVYEKDELVSEEIVQRYYDLSRREGNRQAFIDRAQMVYEDKSELIKNIDHETLIIWGEHDLWTPIEFAYQFDKDIPNSELKIIKNSGHIPMEEDPKLTAKLIEEFIH